MKKRGFTIIELMVALGLFAILSTMIIITFITMVNIQAKATAMKESQQKIRTAVDQITRQIKEADQIIIDPTFTQLTLTYNEDLYAQVRYRISGGRLEYQNCNITSFISGSYSPCNSWYNINYAGYPKQDMLSSNGINSSGNSIQLQVGSQFRWNSPRNSGEIPGFVANDEHNNPPSIKVTLVGKIDYSNAYYDDDFTVSTNIALEAKN
jgi:prepilin-type N-terminal cleavage/methylation domain-containing protein